MKKGFFSTLKWLCKTIAMFIAALFILFAEWGWEPLKKLAFKLTRWPLWKQLSLWVGRLPPYGALASFVIPFVIEKAVELLGLLAIVHKYPTEGIILIVLSKVIGTALIAWVYQLTEPQLLQIPWFSRLHARWIPWKNKVIAVVKESTVWRTAKTFTHDCKKYLQRIKDKIKNLFR